MKYTCNQNINNMKLKHGEIFCELCNHSVINFTDKLKTDVVKANELNPNLCGLYTQKQIDDDIIDEVGLILKSFWLKYVASLTFFIGSSNAISQNTKHKIYVKQVVINSDTNTVCTKNKKITTKETQNSESLSKNKTKHKKNYRRKLYLKKKFPFIAYRKQRLLGRF